MVGGSFLIVPDIYPNLWKITPFHAHFYKSDIRILYSDISLSVCQNYPGEYFYSQAVRKKSATKKTDLRSTFADLQIYKLTT